MITFFFEDYGWIFISDNWQLFKDFRKYKISNYFVEIIGVKFQLEIRIPLEILLREDRYSRGKINGLQTVNIIIYR